MTPEYLLSAQGRQYIGFNPATYLEANPDVATGVWDYIDKFGGDPSFIAAKHYALHGESEGRTWADAPFRSPTRPTSNTDSTRVVAPPNSGPLYTGVNQGSTAISQGNLPTTSGTSSTSTYQPTGPGSTPTTYNRPVSGGFDPNYYLRNNPDVARYVQTHLAEFGGDPARGALAHYMKFGMTEGRSAVPTYGSPAGLATGVVERTPGAIVEPLFSALQNRALDVLETPYTPYSGRQVAQASPLQEQGFAGLAGLAMPSEIMENATRALSETTAAYGRNPYTYEARDITTGLGPVGSVQDYMNPYVQGVVNVQSEEARRQAQIAAQAANAGFASRSAFGGSRQAIENAERERNLAMLLNKVTQEGYSSAYDRAQAQRLAEAGKFQEAQTASEAGRRTVASDTARYGLEALQGAGQSALNEINAQKSIQQQNLDMLNAQLGAGATQRSIEQAGLKADYDDFLREQGYQAKQLADVMPTSSLLLGQSNVTNTYGQPPSSLGQILGLGIAGAGLFNTPTTTTTPPAVTAPPATTTPPTTP